MRNPDEISDVTYLIRVFCDPLPLRPLDALYLFEQTADNQRAVLSRAAEVWRQRRARCIALSAYGPRLGYLGLRQWRATLLRSGLPLRALTTVVNDGSGEERCNTYQEAVTLVRHARAAGWRTIGICAAPFHQPRALLSVISARARHFSPLRVFSVPGHCLPWHEVVVHSQGRLRASRLALVTTEWQRIRRYQRQGDLVSLTTACRYLELRDAH